MTEEQYLEWSEAPFKAKVPKPARHSADFWVKEYLRSISDAPADGVLKRPAAKNPALITDFGRMQELTTGIYKVKKAIFRGEVISEKDISVYWQIPKDGSNWQQSGVYFSDAMSMQQNERQENGTYPIQFFGVNEVLPAAAAFYNGKIVLSVSLKADEKPVIAPAPESGVMRIEMEKVAELPEKIIATPQQYQNNNGQTAVSLPQETMKPVWYSYVQYGASGIAVIALLLAFLLRKKRKENVNNPEF